MDDMHIYQSTVISPEKMLEIFSPEEYEDVVLDWVKGYLKKQKQYFDAERLGGTGDKGRDVIAVYDKTRTIWDNYQCKHYATALSPADIKKEIAKLCYFTFKQEYSIPKNYYFVSPRGLTSESFDLIYNKKELLKKQIIDNWDKDFKKLFGKGDASLTPELIEHIEKKVNFDIFSHISTTEFIEQCKQTNFFSFRFKQCIKRNPNIDIQPPVDVNYKKEENYINHLLDAYTDKYKQAITEDNIPYAHLAHFKRQRTFFYCAEAIEKITRDACRDSKPFDKLKDDIYYAIIDEVENSRYPDGLERLNTCLKEAGNCRISPSNEIAEAVDRSGQQGICHYLANENKVRWVQWGKDNENL